MNAAKAGLIGLLVLGACFKPFNTTLNGTWDSQPYDSSVPFTYWGTATDNTGEEIWQDTYEVNYLTDETENECWSSIDAKLELTSKDGDILRIKTEGTACVNQNHDLDSVGTFVVTGGTGKFYRATGSGTTTGLLVIQGVSSRGNGFASGSYMFNYTGYITTLDF